MKTIENLKDIQGLVIENVEGLELDSEYIKFTFTDGNVLEMYHKQDCCEHVCVNDICGDASDLIGGSVVEFREDVNEEGGEAPSEWSDSWTWTFYNISTTKGSVNIRWLGESNGYYSERVSIDNPNKLSDSVRWNSQEIN